MGVLMGTRVTEVLEGGVGEAKAHAERTLVLMWPDYGGVGTYGLSCLAGYSGERLALVHSLKTKWEEVNKIYQSTSVLSLDSLDTIGKVKRKEMYEAQLAQIEKDIEKLSKKQVYIADDS